MNKNIVIIGMPGSGKTTIGFLLSKKINMNFIDMDDYIKNCEGKTIKEMFNISEDYFRNIETKCSIKLSNLSNVVISTGGGIVKRKENLDYFKENSIIIFLNRPIENIINDIDIKLRPLLQEGKDKIYDLYNERITLYKKYCHIEIINDTTISNTVDKIIMSL